MADSKSKTGDRLLTSLLSRKAADASSEEKSVGHKDEDTPSNETSRAPGRHDLEKGPLKAGVDEKRAKMPEWDGDDDPDNPKNWSKKRRWLATLVVSSFAFLAPVSSSMVAPALPQIARDLKIEDQTESELILSIFVLAFAFGPLFAGPLSEKFGRVIVLQFTNAFYFIFNLACSFARTGPQMLVFRFLAGLGGAAPLAIGGGVLGDCWRAEQRGRAISIYSLAPLLGPAVGPLVGSFVAQYAPTWRWLFWATCAAAAVIQVSGFFFLRETWAPLILARRAKRRNAEAGIKEPPVPTTIDNSSLASRIVTTMSRPFIMLTTQPIVQVLALYMAFLYGLCYLALSTFPSVWTGVYHESIAIGGLNYISQGLGYVLGSQICSPLNDRIYRALKQRNNGVGRPEFRVLIMIPSCVLVPVGLFWYGWSAQARIHWIMPNIGSTLFAAGIIAGVQSIQTYVVDAYTKYAASGLAAITALRSVAGFAFPLFAQIMYARLGLGWGNSLLAFIAIAIGTPAPILLWKYGQHLRSKSTYAAGGGD